MYVCIYMYTHVFINMHIKVYFFKSCLATCDFESMSAVMGSVGNQQICYCTAGSIGTSQCCGLNSI